MLQIAILGMGAHAVVTLIATAFVVAVIAAYLIRIALILWHVIDRLVTILGAVNAVAQESHPMGSVIDDINKDLASGRETFEAAVARLERRRPAREPEPTSGVSATWSHWRGE
ncbi:MAG: hypothetical protein ACR2FZ_00725 [Thermoleophilaceae bacterium]